MDASLQKLMNENRFPVSPDLATAGTSPNDFAGRLDSPVGTEHLGGLDYL